METKKAIKTIKAARSSQKESGCDLASQIWGNLTSIMRIMAVDENALNIFKFMTS